jgi:hypothetical protein
LETFTEPRQFVENPRFSKDRHDTLATLDLRTIDEPIVDIIDGFSAVSHCFTLQSCYGHFLYSAEQDIHSLDPVPPKDTGYIRYRLAYIVFCIENSPSGVAFRNSLAKVPELDPDYIQFGSAEWFWKRHVNSFALQLEPARFKRKDEAILDYKEALHVQQQRGLFFSKLRDLLETDLNQHKKI